MCFLKVLIDLENWKKISKSAQLECVKTFLSYVNLFFSYVRYLSTHVFYIDYQSQGMCGLRRFTYKLFDFLYK